MLATLTFLGRDESAAAAIEYGILIALIALVGFARLGDHVSAIFIAPATGLNRIRRS
jgi:Flp pilus assembly pilin Flp